MEMLVRKGLAIEQYFDGNKLQSVIVSSFQCCMYLQQKIVPLHSRSLLCPALPAVFCLSLSFLSLSLLQIFSPRNCHHHPLTHTCFACCYFLPDVDFHVGISIHSKHATGTMDITESGILRLSSALVYGNVTMN